MHDHEHGNASKKFSDVARLRTPERLERLEVARVVELCLAGGTFENMLDVGTGSGVFAEAFATKGLVVAGIDENQAMLDEAGKFLPQADLRQASAEALPFNDDAFDLVFLGVVLHEVDDPLKALEEARRVSRKRVAVLEWAYREEEMGPPLAHRLKPADLTKLAQTAGLDKIEVLALTKLVLYRMNK